MVAGSDAAFRRHLSRLSPEEQAAFVADLLCARGWRTTVIGTRITATDGDRTWTVGIGGSGVRPDVDELVVIRPAGILPSVRRQIQDPQRGPSRLPDGRTDFETTTVADLRKQLLYAVGRDEAAALVREHFDAVLVTEHDSERSTADRVGPSLPLAAGVAVLLVALGVAMTVTGVVGPAGVDEAVGPFGQEGDRRPASTGDGESGPVGEDDAVGSMAEPSEWTADGSLADLDALVAGHRAAVRSMSDTSTSVVYEGPRFLVGIDTRRSGFDPAERAEYELRVEGDGEYYVANRQTYLGYLNLSEMTTERYGVDGMEYTRRSVDGTVSYSRGPATDDPAPTYTLANGGVSLLRTYLDTNESRVIRVENGNEARYEIVATGEPRQVDHATEDYRATAVVGPDGLVERLSVTYTHVRTGTSLRIRYDVEGGATVTPPAWIEAAREGTA